jgi:hypothetical protein
MSKSEQLMLKIEPKLDKMIDDALIKHTMETGEIINRTEYLRRIIEIYCSFELSENEGLIISAHLASAANKAHEIGNLEGEILLRDVSDKFTGIWNKIKELQNDLHIKPSTKIKNVALISLSHNPLPGGSYTFCRDAKIKIDDILHTVRFAISNTKKTTDNILLQSYADGVYKMLINDNQLFIGRLIINNIYKQENELRYTPGIISSIIDNEVHYEKYPLIVLL